MRYAKFWAAAVAAALTAIQTALPLSASWHQTLGVALAICGAVAVYQIPNTPSVTR